MSKELLELVARAIWNARREDEDRCDVELDDIPLSHSVWREAEASIAATDSARRDAQSALERYKADNTVLCHKVDRLKGEKAAAEKEVAELRQMHTDINEIAQKTLVDFETQRKVVVEQAAEIERLKQALGDGTDHPNDENPREDACEKVLVDMGDDVGQGLHPYWKWAFRTGWWRSSQQQAERIKALGEALTRQHDSGEQLASRINALESDRDTWKQRAEFSFLQRDRQTARIKTMNAVVEAASNLIAQKGRHNTEIAYERLSTAVAEHKKGAA